MATATITSKGQITIPKQIRDFLCVESGDRIQFLPNDDGGVSILPATKDITSLEGIVPKPLKPVTVESMNRTIRARGKKK